MARITDEKINKYDTYEEIMDTLETKDNVTTKLTDVNSKIEWVMSNIDKEQSKSVSGKTGIFQNMDLGYEARARTTILKGLSQMPTISGIGSTITYNKDTGECDCTFYGTRPETYVSALITYQCTLLDLWNNRS